MPLDVHKTILPFGVLLVSLLTLGCSGDARPNETAEWTPADSSDVLHETRIVAPPGTGTLKTAAKEVSGNPVGIACVTCHGQGGDTSESLAERAIASKDARKPTGERIMHTELQFVHGELQCSSCHEADSPNLLHSSDGQTFALEESMRLCSQCHGLIRKAYDNGAHGGMRGYWDLQRGPRERNTCIACHNPHNPAHPQIIPVAGPKDKRVFRQNHPGSLIDQRFGKDQHE